LTNKLLTTFKQDIKSLKLIPAGGGVFELAVGDEVIYSKKKSGTFPDEQWAIDAVRKRMK
jgi:selenoprotein W-related protein